jgi:hypothetical protein
MMNGIRKRFDLQVTVENGLVSQTFELEKSIVAIKGLLMASNMDDMLYFRGSQRIEINREEIFPDGYESKLLMSGINCPPNKRHYDLNNMPPGNGLIKVDFEDMDDGRTTFTPYRVSLYLDCVMKAE